jgi:hypothetical protein
MAAQVKPLEMPNMGEAVHAVLHYSPADLAELWGLSANTIRRLFEREPGVLQIANPRKGRRSYTTLRIPESVAERVHRKLGTP